MDENNVMKNHRTTFVTSFSLSDITLAKCYENAVHIFNSIYAESIYGEECPLIVTDGTIWRNPKVNCDMGIFWLMVDGFKYRKYRQEKLYKNLSGGDNLDFLKVIN